MIKKLSQYFMKDNSNKKVKGRLYSWVRFDNEEEKGVVTLAIDDGNGNVKPYPMVFSTLQYATDVKHYIQTMADRDDIEVRLVMYEQKDVLDVVKKKVTA